nr:GtrA family protein [Helcococcus sueciensis]
MIEKIKDLYSKHMQMINYIFFGGLTTLVNFVTYFVALKVFNIPNVPSNLIAWLVSVLFAFVVNKLYVFRSKSLEMKVILFELFTFVSVRLLTGALETIIMYVGVDIMHYNELVLKIIANVIVLLTNYFGSILIIFRRKDEES